MFFQLRSFFFVLPYLLALQTGCASSILLFPPWHRPAPPKEATAMHLPFRWGHLEIWKKRTQGSLETDAYVLEFCGNATPAESIIDDTVRRWRDLAAEVWIVNYPGYSGSNGPAKLEAIPPAALAAYDELSKSANGRPIYIAGTSLGTTAALYVAAHRPTAGLLLQNPPPLRQLIWENNGWWNLWIGAGIVTAQIPAELDSLTNAASVSAPAVFVLADRDTLVPPCYQHRVVNAFAGSRQLVPLKGANHDSHNTPAQEAEIRKAIQEMMNFRANR